MNIKVEHTRSHTKYGGLIPIVNEMIRRGIPQMIDSAFEGKITRAEQSKYKVSDVFITWFAVAMCGGNRIDDVTGLKEELEIIPNINVPSHDTMGRLMKKMSSEVIGKNRISPRNINMNYYDDNLLMNKLLLKVSKAMGAIKENENYILDIDCTFIHSRCAGATTMKNKDAYGFNPMTCFIGDLPVFISMRGGNSTADYRLKETVEECLLILKEENINIKAVRSDGAGYRYPLVDMLDEMDIGYYLSSPVNKAFKTMWKGLNSQPWKDVIIKTSGEDRICKINETVYNMTFSEVDVRVIALRIPNEDVVEKLKKEIEEAQNDIYGNKNIFKHKNKRYQGADWGELGEFRYKIITTNDFKTKAEEIVQEYNLRGGMEAKIGFMKQDFGWRIMPFRWLSENAVFMIIAAMANNVFRASAKMYSEYTELELNARIKKFRNRFIMVLCVFTKDEGMWFDGTKIDFEKIC